MQYILRGYITNRNISMTWVFLFQPSKTGVLWALTIWEILIFQGFVLTIIIISKVAISLQGGP